MPTLTKSVQEPWFTLLKLKIKKVEGRLFKGDFATLKPGDIINFKQAVHGAPYLAHIQLKVKRIQKFESFHDFLTADLAAALPGVDDVKTGVEIYHSFYSEQDERQYGVCAVYFVSNTGGSRRRSRVRRARSRARARHSRHS